MALSILEMQPIYPTIHARSMYDACAGLMQPNYPTVCAGLMQPNHPTIHARSMYLTEPYVPMHSCALRSANAVAHAMALRAYLTEDGDDDDNAADEAE